jgi:hypothetical protein
MKFQEGYVYHIKDEYFSKAQDEKLMQNKEKGTYRPTFLCMEDRKNAGLLWVVPMSTQVGKYQTIHDKQQARYGKCLTIVMGEFDGQPSAFLLQNLFPITEYYLDHIHTRNGNPVPVKHSIAQEVRSNMQQLRQLIYRGKKVVFPDIQRLEKMMLAELQAEKKTELTEKPQEKLSMKDRFAAAQAEAERRATATTGADQKKHDSER